MFKNLFKKDNKSMQEQVKDNDTIMIKLEKSKTVKYSDVTGFFKYNNQLFYRPEKGTGKTLFTDISFTTYVKENIDEFKNASSFVICELEVEQYKISE